MAEECAHLGAGRNWLFRASSLADRFRNRYLRAVRRRLDRGTLVLPAGTEDWNDVCARLAATDWIVYAKKPFAGPRQALEYLGRYTHKVAISDYRILQLEDGRVTFRYRDRADGDTEKTMTLSADAFIGRFLLHILPPGFQKIRFYGWMARNVRTENLRHIRQALNVPPPDVPPKPPRIAPDCPACGKATLLIEGLIGRARGPSAPPMNPKPTTIPPPPAQPHRRNAALCPQPAKAAVWNTRPRLPHTGNLASPYRKPPRILPETQRLGKCRLARSTKPVYKSHR
ncbi:MAG: transposase [Kiritimatiellae bacterium]|nr:transposase [Kiritimatiellia bacterium]